MKNQQGKRALTYEGLGQAADEGDVEACKKILEAKVNPNPNPDPDRNQRDFWDGVDIPLLQAANNGHLEVVQLLVENGVDIDCMDYSSQTALTRAAECGHLSVVKYLVEVSSNTKADDNWMQKALITASRNGYRSLVNDLNKALEDIHFKDDKYGLTMLAQDWERKNFSIIEFLHEQYASDDDIDAKDEYGLTELMNASSDGYLSLVECLVKAGANINATNYIGETAMILAFKNGHLEVVNYLLKKGASYGREYQGYETIHPIAQEVYKAKSSAFILGVHDRVGRDSKVKKHFRGPLGERQVLRLILDFINPDADENPEKGHNR